MYFSESERAGRAIRSGHFPAKRVFDFVIALCALALLAPLMVLVMTAIFIDSPGSIFFSQLRFGQNGRLFRIWKFRTMHVAVSDASGGQRTLAWDPRVTRIGRFLRRTSIDELPQLLNVLLGHMSLVGPRPHTPHMRVEGVHYHEAVPNYHLRHLVRPGLTGWAQVNGSRGEVDTMAKAHRRVDLDLWYVENRSAYLDLRIVLRTAVGGFLSLRAD
ncbi:sugar transferase [Roseomonas sp. BN140053]|uniref:sugar transferase n=1 Tax=Roseomonas sp. BN140053 TaxID=3391898 RepID=UPI0039E96534